VTHQPPALLIGAITCPSTVYVYNPLLYRHIFNLVFASPSRKPFLAALRPTPNPRDPEGFVDALTGERGHWQAFAPTTVVDRWARRAHIKGFCNGQFHCLWFVFAAPCFVCFVFPLYSPRLPASPHYLSRRWAARSFH
jgi:hypothetical protein